MKNVCIICSSKLPQPPTCGGAVPILIQEWIDQNEIEGKINLHCISIFEKEAFNKSNSYKKTSFEYIKIPKFYGFLDALVVFLLKIIKKRNRINSFGFLFRILYLKRTVKKILMKNDFDEVIFENSIPILLCLKNKKLLAKYKGKYYYHAHAVPRSMFNSGYLLEQAKAVICVSNYIKNEIDNVFKGYKIISVVIKNCIDTSIFKPINAVETNKWRKSIGLQENDFAIGFIARMTKDKGIMELLEAVKLINDKNIKLVIAGTTFYQSNINDGFIDKLKAIAEPIKENVIFTGYMNNSKTPLFYSGCNIICLPSVWEEPAGNTIIEATMCGRPLITTISGGIPEYVDEKCAILIDKNDQKLLIQKIMEAIVYLKSNPQAATNLGKNALLNRDKYNSATYYKNICFLLTKN